MQLSWCPFRHSHGRKANIGFGSTQPETISELMRKQKEHQIKKEVIEDTDMAELQSTVYQDGNEVEEIGKASSIIPSPLTPPTPDPLTKEKTHVKLEALPVSSCGMMDRTRVALFAFMFTFLFVNPLSYVFPQLDKGKQESFKGLLSTGICLHFSVVCIWDSLQCS